MESAMISTGLVVVSVIFPILSLAAIFLRLKARRNTRLELMADDWWIIAAWIPCLAMSVNIWIFSSITGVNTYKINYLLGVERSMQGLLICSVILQPCLTAVKISLLLFYKRIFSTKPFAIAIWAAVSLVAAWGILFFFLVLFEGDPISKSWTGIGHWRYDEVAIGLAQSGSSIGLDIAVLLFPIPILFSLQMPMRQKVGVMLIFWLGAFCCIAAIVRLALLRTSLSEVASNRNLILLESKMIIFMFIEPNCSIIAACLPTYGGLLAGGRTLKSVISSWRSVFSIRSQITSLIGNRSGENSTVKHTEDSVVTNTYSNNESQTEFAMSYHAPSSAHGAIANVSTSPYPSDEETATVCQSPGIKVKTRLDVSTV